MNESSISYSNSVYVHFYTNPTKQGKKPISANNTVNKLIERKKTFADPVS